MKKAEVSTDFLIKAILATLVLITLFYLFYSAYPKLISSANELGWDEVSLSEQSRVKSNFEGLFNLLENCNSKFNCLCGTKKGFPFSFREEEKIILNNTLRDSCIMTLMHRNVKIGEYYLNQNVFLNSVEYDLNEITFKGEDYYINGRKGQKKKSAFSKTGKALFLFNDKVKKDNPVYTHFLNYSKIC